MDQNKSEFLKRTIKNIISCLNEGNCHKAIFMFFDLDKKSADKVIEYIINHPKYIYKFCKYIHCNELPSRVLPLDRFIDVMIMKCAADDIYKFARDIEGASIDKLAQGIIATMNAKYIYKFAKNVKGAPITALEEAVFRTGNTRYVYKFARDIQSVSEENLIMLSIFMIMDTPYCINVIGDTAEDLLLLSKIESYIPYLERLGYNTTELEKIINYQKLKFGVGDMSLLQGNIYSAKEKKQLVKTWLYNNKNDLLFNYLSMEEQIESEPSHGKKI